MEYLYPLALTTLSVFSIFVMVLLFIVLARMRKIEKLLKGMDIDTGSYAEILDEATQQISQKIDNITTALAKTSEERDLAGQEWEELEEEVIDGLYESALQEVRKSKKCSVSFLQRRLKIGYARAARLVDMLEENDIVSEADGAKLRHYIEDVESEES